MKIYYTLASLCLAFVLTTSCRKDDIISPSEHTIFEAPSTSGVDLALDTEVEQDIALEVLGTDLELRAYEGQRVLNTKLRPQIKDGKAKIVVVLGSTNSTSVYSQELDWLYDQTNDRLLSASSVSGSGANQTKTPLKLNAPEALLRAGGLRMLLIMATSGSYDAQSQEVRMNTESRGIRIAKEVSGTIGLKVPYISDWQDVSYDGRSLSMPVGQRFRLKPQGRVLKVTVTNNQDIYSDLKLRGLAIQTNVMSFFGKYALGSITKQQVAQRTLPAWQELDHEVANRLDGGRKYRTEIERRRAENVQQVDRVTQANYIIDLPQDEDLGAKGTSQTFYAWFVERPEAYKQNGTQGQSPFSRFYVRAARSGQTGDDVKGTYSFMPAYYTTKSVFSKRGVRLNLSVDNKMVHMPMQYFANTRIVSAFSNYGATENPTKPNDKWEMKMDYPSNQHLSQNLTMRFHWNELNSNGYFGSKQKAGVTWYIPYPNEMRALIPLDAGTMVDNVFHVDAQAGTEANDVDEDLKLYIGANRAETGTFKASYYRMPNINRNSFWEGNVEIAALRYIKDGDHSLKTAFVYTLANDKGRTQNNSTQYHYRVQAYHLGNHFPEIRTAKDFYRYKAEIVDSPLYWWRENSRYLHGTYANRNMIALHLTGDNYNYRVVKANDTRAPFTERTIDQRFSNNQSGYRNNAFGVHMMRRSL